MLCSVLLFGKKIQKVSLVKQSLKKYNKLPSFWQWKQVFRFLTKKERFYFFIFFFLAIFSGVSLSLNFYFKNTRVLPAFGGIYKEGVIGQPRFINPIYLSSNDVDRDLVELLFSGLLKYNENGKLVKDLAENFEVKDDGRIFEFYLKKGAKWHDGNPLSPEDIVFTINTIQDPQYQSPLRTKWFGVKVEKISDNGVRFELQKRYSSFLENFTLKIVPKHIFEHITPENLPWSLTSPEYLIGSGPFKFKKLYQDKSGYIKKITLESNKNYYDKKPFLSQISFLFYQQESELKRAVERKEIQGFSISDPKNLKTTEKSSFELHSLSLPRYFALFFNLKVKGIFSEKILREALALSIDKNEILENVLLKKGEIVESPILAEFFNFNPPSKVYNFDKEKAKEILEQEGFKINPETGKREKSISQQASPFFTKDLIYGNEGEEVRKLQECLANPPAGGKEIYPEGEITGYFGEKTKAAVIKFQEKYANDILTPTGLKRGTGDVKSLTRKKLNEICYESPKETIPLKLVLTTVNNFPLTEIAEVLEKNWEEVGIEVTLKKVSIAELQTDTFAGRNFEILLFGEALGMMPDPFPFWHSSQKEHPGLNISSYTSEIADTLLEKARETSDQEKRKKNLEEFQEVLVKDLPAIFLVRTDYVYFLSPSVKGCDVKKITEPSERFTNIENWYVKTKRIWD